MSHSEIILVSTEEESLSPPGGIGSQHIHTRLRRAHTHSHTHGDEEGWLSSQRTLQAAACLGKPDAFLPPGTSTHCHLKGSLLGLNHPQLRGREPVGVPVPSPGSTPHKAM